MKMPKEKTLSELKKMTDDEIDFSDIPELNDEFWKNAEWAAPEKTRHLTIRIKQSVLDYFKSGGKGYQTRINAVLEAYVCSQKRPKPSHPSH